MDGRLASRPGLASASQNSFAGGPSRDAAVLLGIHEDVDAGLQVVLIERADDIGTHRGDIAFPGGSLEPGETHTAAALRETYEEVGIPPLTIDLVAELSTHPISEGFVIWPFIGVLRQLPDRDHVNREVARVLVTPLAGPVRDGAWWRERWPPEPAVVLDYFRVQGDIAWGTTGALLRELLEICITGRLAREGRRGRP